MPSTQLYKKRKEDGGSSSDKAASPPRTLLAMVLVPWCSRPTRRMRSSLRDVRIHVLVFSSRSLLEGQGGGSVPIVPRLLPPRRATPLGLFFRVFVRLRVFSIPHALQQCSSWVDQNATELEPPSCKKTTTTNLGSGQGRSQPARSTTHPSAAQPPLRFGFDFYSGLKK